MNLGVGGWGGCGGNTQRSAHQRPNQFRRHSIQKPHQLGRLNFSSSPPPPVTSSPAPRMMDYHQRPPRRVSGKRGEAGEGRKVGGRVGKVSHYRDTFIRRGAARFKELWSGGDPGWTGGGQGGGAFSRVRGSNPRPGLGGESASLGAGEGVRGDFTRGRVSFD